MKVMDNCGKRTLFAILSTVYSTGKIKVHIGRGKCLTGMNKLGYGGRLHNEIELTFKSLIAATNFDTLFLICVIIYTLTPNFKSYFAKNIFYLKFPMLLLYILYILLTISHIVEKYLTSVRLSAVCLLSALRHY